MPVTEEYFSLIIHNKNLLEVIALNIPDHLEGEDFSDWKVTLSFYIICIYVKTYLNLIGIDVQDHYTLKQHINTIDDLIPIAKNYRHIEEASRDARYEGRKYDDNYLTNRILPKYNQIRNKLIALLKKKYSGAENVPNIKIENYLT